MRGDYSQRGEKRFSIANSRARRLFFGQPHPQTKKSSVFSCKIAKKYLVYVKATRSWRLRRICKLRKGSRQGPHSHHSQVLEVLVDQRGVSGAGQLHLNRYIPIKKGRCNIEKQATKSICFDPESRAGRIHRLTKQYRVSRY